MAIDIQQTTVDYGPLTPLIGKWQGDAGVDISPEEEGEERNLYHEELNFYPARSLSNADEQDLVVLAYHQVVFRKSDNKMIHNESGYLSWDPANRILMKSFSIPRGVAVVAGGKVTEELDSISFEVKAALNDPEWGIVQSPFMQGNAQTKSYLFSMKVSENQLYYSQSMQLDIFGKSFKHTDKNHLRKLDE